MSFRLFYTPVYLITSLTVATILQSQHSHPRIPKMFQVLSISSFGIFVGITGGVSEEFTFERDKSSVSWNVPTTVH